MVYHIAYEIVGQVVDPEATHREIRIPMGRTFEAQMRLLRHTSGDWFGVPLLAATSKPMVQTATTNPMG